MFIRVVQKMRNKAKERLKAQQATYLAQFQELVTALREVALAYGREGTTEQCLRAIGACVELHLNRGPRPFAVLLSWPDPPSHRLELVEFRIPSVRILPQNRPSLL
jgi:hypothetical protein